MCAELLRQQLNKKEQRNKKAAEISRFFTGVDNKKMCYWMLVVR